MTVAIIRFPGSNCESETYQALSSLDIKSEIIDWNLHTDSLSDYSGFILPGGFSFQDRIRAGVIASKLPILDALKEQVNQHNKPILGICNGAQILVESGIISIQPEQPNLDTIIDFNHVEDRGIGFISDWAFLKPFNINNSIFLNHFSETDVIPIQICHGEGRFIVSDEPTSGFKYCSINGGLSEQFPITPNGSMFGLAAISNVAGNAFAIMPHPERSLIRHRFPYAIQHKLKSDNITIASWQPLFLTFKDSTDA